jgi:ABC-type Zn2+ transport system substrate-binding protein/surface adhesin
MRRLRTSGMPAVLLALILGVAPLLFGVGHSHAHRQSPHVSHSSADHHDAADHHGSVDHHEIANTAVIAFEDGHASNDHPHLDLTATPPAKTILQALVVRAVTDLWDLIDDEVRVPLIASAAHTLRGREHGPPPPARAPPIA